MLFINIIIIAIASTITTSANDVFDVYDKLS